MLNPMNLGILPLGTPLIKKHLELGIYLVSLLFMPFLNFSYFWRKFHITSYTRVRMFYIDPMTYLQFSIHVLPPLSMVHIRYFAKKVANCSWGGRVGKFANKSWHCFHKPRKGNATQLHHSFCESRKSNATQSRHSLRVGILVGWQSM